MADVRIHGTTKKQVAQLFAEEKKHLLALPASLFPVFQEAPRSVHRDSYVEVNSLGVRSQISKMIAPEG